MSQLLVADIGGTNARFGLVELNAANAQQNYSAENQKTLKCANYADIASMIKAYCSEVNVSLPTYACLAIAGPIENGFAQMTNLKWKFSIEELRVQLGMHALDVINDFAALAYATLFLPANDIKPLYEAKSNLDSAIVVLRPGTGFGMAALIPNRTTTQRGWGILPTEGGHCSFAPTNEKEEHTSELQSRPHLVCRLLLEKKKTLLNHLLIYTITLNISLILLSLIYVALKVPHHLESLSVALALRLNQEIHQLVSHAHGV